jgi:hypothetical protein
MQCAAAVLQTCAVAGPEADTEVFGESELYVIPANETLTFEHTYTWWGECWCVLDQTPCHACLVLGACSSVWSYADLVAACDSSHSSGISPSGHLPQRLHMTLNCGNANTLFSDLPSCPPHTPASDACVPSAAALVAAMLLLLPLLLLLLLLLSGHSRKLRVTANPNITISRAHVPWRCRWARVVLLGPLTLHDVDAGSFATHEGECGSNGVGVCWLAIEAIARARTVCILGSTSLDAG